MDTSGYLLNSSSFTDNKEIAENARLSKWLPGEQIVLGSGTATSPHNEKAPSLYLEGRRHRNDSTLS